MFYEISRLHFVPLKMTDLSFRACRGIFLYLFHCFNLRQDAFHRFLDAVFQRL